MLKFITANDSHALDDVFCLIECPENGKSAWEQLEWLKILLFMYLRYFTKQEYIIKTYSPYILTALNIYIADGTLNESSLDVVFYSIDEEGNRQEHSLMAKDENGMLVVDTYDITEPMAYITEQYQTALSKRENEKESEGI